MRELCCSRYIPDRRETRLISCADVQERATEGSDKSHAVRRVRPDALRPVRGLGEPQQAASEYPKGYSDALLAYAFSVRIDCPISVTITVSQSKEDYRYEQDTPPHHI